MSRVHGGKEPFRRETQLRWALFSGRRNTFPPKMRFSNTYTFPTEFEHIRLDWLGELGWPDWLGLLGQLCWLGPLAGLGNGWSAVSAWLDWLGWLNRLGWVTALPEGYQPRSRGVFPHILKSCWTSVATPSIPTVLCLVCMSRGYAHVLKTQFPRLEVPW